MVSNLSPNTGDPAVINVSERIDSVPIGAFQWRVVLLCFLVALLDGLDVQAMALTVPSLAIHWGVDRSSFGPVLSSSFAGIMLGAISGGSLGDRIGRRNILILAFLVVGGSSIATAAADTQSHLIIYRFLTGLGIGACMPNFTALTAEYVPSHRQSFFVTLIYSAIPIGGIAGGYLAPPLIAWWGWQAVFLFAGLVPLLICLAMLLWLPESIRFLTGRGRNAAHVGMILERIDSGYRHEAHHRFVVDSAPSKSSPLRALFEEGRAATTLLLWVVFFGSLFSLYLLTSWLPSVLTQVGWPLALAARSISYFFIGGVIGGVVVGWLIDRINPYPVLLTIFAAGAVFTALIGVVAPSFGMMMPIIALAGFTIVGAQTGTTAFAAKFYPMPIRSTGVGWCLGIGRFGAVVSPLLGGAGLAAGWSRSELFPAAAVPGILCALAMSVLWFTRRGPPSQPDKAT